LIFQYESNEHRKNTENRTTPHKTTNNKPPHLDDEITKKNFRSMWKTLIYIEI